LATVPTISLLRHHTKQDIFAQSGFGRMTGKPEVISANPIRVIYFGLADNTSAERLQLDVARVV
jgi:hypothetical protein